MIHIIGSKDALEEGRQGQGAEIVSGEDPSHPHQTSEEGERRAVIKSKNLHTILLYLARISFIIDGKLKSFTDKQK